MPSAPLLHKKIARAQSTARGHAHIFYTFILIIFFSLYFPPPRPAAIAGILARLLGIFAGAAPAALYYGNVRLGFFTRTGLPAALFTRI